MEGLLPVYGMTETTSISTISGLDDPRSIVLAGKGRPVSDFEIKIADVESGAEQPAGAEGEVYVRGHPVMIGYYRNEEATAAAIDPDGWFHTGDLGVLDDDGYLSITGRKSDMFIVGGSNAYPAEIESALAEYPAIEQVYVVGVPHHRSVRSGSRSCSHGRGRSSTRPTRWGSPAGVSPITRFRATSSWSPAGR